MNEKAARPGVIPGRPLPSCPVALDVPAMFQRGRRSVPGGRRPATAPRRRRPERAPGGNVPSRREHRGARGRLHHPCGSPSPGAGPWCEFALAKPAMTRGPCKHTSGIATFSTRCAIPNWHRTGQGFLAVVQFQRRRAFMKIFLSYASEDRPTADSIEVSLRTRGHIVFFRPR